MNQRLVKIETTVLMDFAEGMSDHGITSFLNNSSHCAINELAKLDHSDDKQCGCFCTTFTVVGEPSLEQLEAHQFIDIRERAPDQVVIADPSALIFAEGQGLISKHIEKQDSEVMRAGAWAQGIDLSQAFEISASEAE